MSDKTELERQLMQILYTESFVRHSSEQAEPMDFLYTSIGHNVYKQELIKQWPLPLQSLAPGEMENQNLQDIRDIMEITGQIKVVNQESNKSLKNTKHQKMGQQSIKDTQVRQMQDLHVIAASDLGGGLGGCVNEAVRRQLARVLALPRLLLTRLPRLLRRHGLHERHW